MEKFPEKVSKMDSGSNQNENFKIPQVPKIGHVNAPYPSPEHPSFTNANRKRD